MLPFHPLRREPALTFLRPGIFPKLAFPYFEVGISAGFPSPADDYLQKRLDLNLHLVTHPAATFFAYVGGDSMRDANLFDGDLLLIDKSLEPMHDNIVVAILNGDFVVKRLYAKGGAIKLIPENPLYPVIEIREGMDFEIWGVVSYIIRKAR